MDKAIKLKTQGSQPHPEAIDKMDPTDRPDGFADSAATASDYFPQSRLPPLKARFGRRWALFRNIIPNSPTQTHTPTHSHAQERSLCADVLELFVRTHFRLFALLLISIYKSCKTTNKSTCLDEGRAVREGREFQAKGYPPRGWWVVEDVGVGNQNKKGSVFMWITNKISNLVQWDAAVGAGTGSSSSSSSWSKQ